MAGGDERVQAFEGATIFPRMTIIPVDPTRPDPHVIAEAAAIIRRGGLVAFPTETVYGLGANALDAAAVRRIFAAKGRPSYNPLIAHVPDEAAARALAAIWPKNAVALARAFWPGPLTLVLPKRREVPSELTAGLDKVAIRVPSHPVALALLRDATVPIAAPSANRFTELSPTTAQHVERALGDRVDLILDGGPTEVGIESTVVDVSGNRPVLLRPGMLSIDDLSPVVGWFGIASEPASGDAPRPSPGMIERHYAPRASVLLFDAADHDALRAAVQRLAAEGKRIGGLMLFAPSPGVHHEVRMPTEPPSYARRLYATLHALDDQGCDFVVVERPPESAAWAGVRDRLKRAGT